MTKISHRYKLGPNSVKFLLKVMVNIYLYRENLSKDEELLADWLTDLQYLQIDKPKTSKGVFDRYFLSVTGIGWLKEAGLYKDKKKNSVIA